jgi:hypothetical protein
MVAAVTELNPPHIVDAAQGSEQADMTNPDTETSTFTVIQPTPQGYRAMKQQFLISLGTYGEQLDHLDQLLAAVQSSQFGEATGNIHMLVEKMVETERSTIEESLEQLRSGIAELERGGY